MLMRVDEKKVHSCLFVLSLATCFSTISANDMSTLDQRETGSKQDPISQGSSEHGRDQRHHRHQHRHHHRHQSDPDQHKHRHRRSHREHRHFSSSSSNKLGKADDPFPQRDAWMLSAGNGGQGAFPPIHRDTSFSLTRSNVPPENASAPVSTRELNPVLAPEQPSTPSTPLASSRPSSSSATFGGPGFKWRMMKLERTYDTAEQLGVSVEQVALDRYGSLQAFDDARAEKRYLEDQHLYSSVSKDASTSRSNSAFRRPGTTSSLACASKSGPDISKRVSEPKNVQTFKEKVTAPSVSMPIASSVSHEHSVLGASELNKLEAQVLRAEFANRPDAQALRRELESARKKIVSTAPSERVEPVPVIDGFGRMYDIGTRSSSEATIQAESLRSSKRPKFESDAPDDVSLSDLVRQERFTAGRADQKDYDMMLSQQIAGDRAFVNDTDYLDDEAQRFARKRMRDDAMKRQFAIQGTCIYRTGLENVVFS